MEAFLITLIAGMLFKLGILNNDITTIIVAGITILLFGAVSAIRTYEYITKEA